MKHWYLLAYDVRDPRRLRKVHYYLRKQALALQNSVFLVQVNRSELKTMLKEVRSRSDTQADDIRLYPVTHPNKLWAAGKQAQTMSGLYAGSPKQARADVGVDGFFKTLFKKLKWEKTK